MRKVLLFCALIAVINLVSACGASPSTQPTTPTPSKPAPTTPATPASPAPPQSPPAATIDGAKLYQTNCAACHGAGAAGGLNLGQVSVPDIRAAALQSVYRSDVNLIKKSIIDGKDKEGKDLNAAMPRWAGKLSDAEVEAIIKYLQTLR